MSLIKTVVLVACLTISNISYADFNLSYLRNTYNPFAGCVPASTHASNLFTRVLEEANNYAKLPQLFFCKNDFVPNVYAQSYSVNQSFFDPFYNQWRQRPVPVYRIDYNPNFMGSSDVSVNNEFALMGILAHEIGHIEHFSKLMNPRGREYWKANYDLNVPWEKELRADEFAGYVLAKMGASIDDVIDTQRTIFTLHVNSNYKDSVSRIQRMFEGYKKGKNNEISEDDQSKINNVAEIAEQYLRWR